jgi:restriction endonuclease Mrr
MCAYFTDAAVMTNFWEYFEGDKTLQNAVRHFVKNYNYKNFETKSDFAIKIMPDIIGKNFEKRKLLELLELELSYVDLSSISVQATSQHADSFQKISIFDADKLDGFSFESFIAKILQSNGFTDVSVTRGSGDQGGDVLARRGDEKLVIQTKRFSIDKKVTNSAVQEVLGAIAWYNVNKGVVITNSIFTNSAKELAKRNNIELWDRKTVTQMLEVYNEKSGNLAS